MVDIAQNLTGLATAVKLTSKCSEGQRENSAASKNFETADLFSCDEQPVSLPARSENGGEDCIPGLPGAGSAAPRTPGRPKGARNRSTEEWRKYILSKYKSPLVMLCEVYSRPLAELKKEVNCDALDAFKLQLSAAQAAIPYLHQKQPLAIEDNRDSVPVININVSSFDAKILADRSGNIRPELTSVEMVTDAEFAELLDEQEAQCKNDADSND